MSPAPPAQQKAKAKLGAPNAVVAHGGNGSATTTKTPIMEARSSSSVVHRVKQGETLWSIARAYQTTVEAIQAGNRFLFSRPLQVGDTLTILPTR
jgi:LysM repeat protein